MPIIRNALRKGINTIKGAAVGAVAGASSFGAEAGASGSSFDGLITGAEEAVKNKWNGSLAETVVNGNIFTRGGMEKVGAEAVKRLSDGSSRGQKSKIPDSVFVRAQMNPGLGQPQEEQAPIQSSVMPQKMVSFGDHLSEAFENII